MLFSRAVAGRPCLASFLRSPLRAERGSGARVATGDAHATRAEPVHRGWFSPPRSSRSVRALWWSSPLPLLSSCRRSSSLSRVFSSAAAPCGARATRAGRDGRRAGDVRSARASRVVDHRRSRTGAFARRGALLLLGSSLVPSVAPRYRWHCDFFVITMQCNYA